LSSKVYRSMGFQGWLW